MTAPNRHFFVSDLHMFSRRSQTERYERQMQALLPECETMILGGDIFDFRWSQHGSYEESITTAIRWLKDLVEEHRHCSFHYLLGNHDACHEFVDELATVADEFSNFCWDEHFLRMGTCIFLHGDVLDGRPTHDEHVRRRRHWQRGEAPRGKLANQCYDVAIKLGVHKGVARILNSHDKVTSKLLKYLADIGATTDDGIEHVYFGHTHHAMDGFTNSGMKFYNGGAPIQGLEFTFTEVPDANIG